MIYDLIKELLTEKSHTGIVAAQEIDKTMFSEDETRALQELWEAFMDNFATGKNYCKIVRCS